MLAKMKTIPDVVDADSTLVTGKPELRVVIDRARAADLGVRVGDIAQALNTLVAGQKVSTFNAGTDQYDVRVRAIGRVSRQRRRLEADDRLVVEDWLGQSRQSGARRRRHRPSAIDRLNRQRQVMLLANVKPGGSQAAVIAKLNSLPKKIKIDSAYKTGLAGRSKELGRAGYYFMLAFVLSFVFMYMVLAAQFESFIHPVTILLTLPLAIPFGILSLLVTGQTVNIFSGLGLLLLFGVVKKNAILQIDHTNQFARAGHGTSRSDHSGESRSPASDSDDDDCAGRRHVAADDFERPRLGHEPLDRRAGGRRAVALFVADAAGGAGFYSLFDDLARSRVWGRIGSERWRRVRPRAQTCCYRRCFFDRSNV